MRPPRPLVTVTRAMLGYDCEADWYDVTVGVLILAGAVAVCGLIGLAGYELAAGIARHT